MATRKMNYEKGCKWEAGDPINDAMLEVLRCVKEKGAEEKTCSDCPFRAS
uniref:Uncharacterized protein n=1 Tax=viral metagenome TaxID=1070528 RepID=A0A6M3KSM5_9ZZZZ